MCTPWTEKEATQKTQNQYQVGSSLYWFSLEISWLVDFMFTFKIITAGKLGRQFSQ